MHALVRHVYESHEPQSIGLARSVVKRKGASIQLADCQPGSHLQCCFALKDDNETDEFHNVCMALFQLYDDNNRGEKCES